MSRIEYVAFAVNEKPFCAWGYELKLQTLEFLRGIDPNYYVHVSEVHSRELEGPQRLHAATAIRMAYAQALETFLAFAAAAWQAPAFPCGWLLRYQVADLREVIKRIGASDLKFRRLPVSTTWEAFSEAVHCFSFNAAADEVNRAGFARAWASFAADFLDPKADEEYNSIKHGLRANPGGFSIALGVPGVDETDANRPPPLPFAGSEFGASYPTTEWLSATAEKTHFFTKRVHRNWDPVAMHRGIVLLAASTNNVIQYLKLIAGATQDEISIIYGDADDFDAPWPPPKGASVSNMEIADRVVVDDIKLFSRPELAAMMRSTMKKEGIATDDTDR